MLAARMLIQSSVVTTCCGISCNTSKGQTTDSVGIPTQETLIPQRNAMPSKPGTQKAPEQCRGPLAVSKNN